MDLSFAAERQTPEIAQPKGGRRLDAIRARMVAQQVVHFQCSPVARLVRRDWTVTTAKMVFKLRDARSRDNLTQDLTDLHWAVDDLVDELNVPIFNNLDRSWLEPKPLEMVMVHSSAASLLRALIKFDACYAKLLTAVEMGMIDKHGARKSSRAALMVYFALKESILDSNSQSATEMAEEQGW